MKNYPKFRIKKYPKGYAVEVELIKRYIFWTTKKWIPFIKSAGLETAWHHSTYDFALMNLLDEIKKQVIVIE